MKLSKYIFIVLILIGVFSPLAEVAAQTSVSRWYFEKKASPVNEVVGGYEYEAGCRTVEQRTPANLIIKSCAPYTSRPAPTPQGATPTPPPEPVNQDYKDCKATAQANPIVESRAQKIAQCAANFQDETSCTFPLVL